MDYISCLSFQLVKKDPVIRFYPVKFVQMSAACDPSSKSPLFASVRFRRFWQLLMIVSDGSPD